MRRAFVLGNCQATAICDWMTAAAPELSVHWASIAGVAPGDPAAAKDWSVSIAAADTIFCQLTDKQLTSYGLSTGAGISAASKKFVRLPVLAFKGFHPDCTYIFSAGHAAVGAMGPYHSAIATAAFLEGLNVSRTLDLYNTFTYAALGYFAEFSAASDVLGEVCAEMGFDLAPALRTGGQVCMHTINHPTIALLGHLACQSLESAGIPTQADVPAPHDHLGDSFRWPVYPEIAARLAVPGSLSFQASVADGEDNLGLEEVVVATHSSLASIKDSLGAVLLDQDRPMATPVIERAQAFIRLHVVL